MVCVYFLDRYLLEDEPRNSWNKYEGFDKSETKNDQNSRKCVADFDLKFRKLEKLHIKLPPEIFAFKLLIKANFKLARKTGVNIADKVNMCMETKPTLTNLMGY